VVHWFSSTNKTCRNICFHYCFILPLLSKEYIEKKTTVNMTLLIINTVILRRVWRYQRGTGNQNPLIEEQTTQWPKEKVSTFKSFVIVQISHVTRKESAIIPKHDSHLIYISPITVPQLQLQWSAVAYVVHVSKSNSCCSICVVLMT
jgi:hypothetical protein